MLIFVVRFHVRFLQIECSEAMNEMKTVWVGPYATYDQKKAVWKLVTRRIERSSLPNICAIFVRTPGAWGPVPRLE